MRFLYLILALLSIVAFVRGGPGRGKNVCNLPMAIGKTKGNFPRFYFSGNAQKCLEFGYGGSGGNGNNFKTLRDCNNKCVCNLPPKKGNGMALDERWYFNQKENACKKFEFGGANGNANNFMSRNECLTTCRVEETSKEGKKSKGRKRTTTTQPSRGGKKSKGRKRTTTRQPSTGGKKVCTQPMKKGKGKGNHERWYYNGQVCKKFSFKGRKGNANNFKSEKECRKACVDGNSNGENPSTGEEDVCQQPKEVGRGRASHPRWYYNGQRCMKFIFGGGKGNGNNFMSKKECMKACVNGNSNGENPPTEEEDFCQLPMEVGDGKAKKQRYYYNQKKQRCMKFSYGGQGGNGNNFENFKACNMNCVCGQPMKKGKGSRKQTRWYYNQMENECKQFKYGGKDGNANNFKKQRACLHACLKPLDD